jgi:hypothetical protein
MSSIFDIPPAATPSTHAKRISRRSVIKGAGAGAVTTVAVGLPGFGSVAFASNNSNRVGDVIVNVFLRGGMDGLSVVVPRHDGAGASQLLAARPHDRTRSGRPDSAQHRLRPPSRHGAVDERCGRRINSH